MVVSLSMSALRWTDDSSRCIPPWPVGAELGSSTVFNQSGVGSVNLSHQFSTNELFTERRGDLPGVYVCACIGRNSMLRLHFLVVTEQPLATNDVTSAHVPDALASFFDNGRSVM